MQEQRFPDRNADINEEDEVMQQKYSPSHPKTAKQGLTKIGIKVMILGIVLMLLMLVIARTIGSQVPSSIGGTMFLISILFIVVGMLFVIIGLVRKNVVKKL